MSRLSREPHFMKTVNQYATNVASCVATLMIKEKIKNPPYEEGYTGNPFEISLYAESHGNYCNKAYRMLQDAGVLTSYIKRDVHKFSMHGSNKPDYRWFGVVNKEWFDKNALSLAAEPKFEILTTIKENSYSSRLATEEDSYRDITRFTDSENIWIYYHLDEYDINYSTEKISHSHRGQTKTTYHNHTKIFPKCLLGTASVSVYGSKADAYLLKNLGWGVENVLGIRNDTILGKLYIGSDFIPELEFKKKKYRTKVFVNDQIHKVEFMLFTMQNALKSLTLLKEGVDRAGGWDEFEKTMKLDFMQYLQNNYPLHTGEHEVDKDLRELCMMIVEGKDKGLNPRIQELEKAVA